MIKNVICPSGRKVPATECLAGRCPDPHRCRPLSFIIAALSERTWNGIPSVTQLISGTRYSWLKLTTDYDLSPATECYKVLGTSVHAGLEEEDSVSFTEERFEHESISGQADRIEIQPNGDLFLIDYKVVGSYKIATAIGMVKAKEPIVDEKGNPVYFKSGARKGQQKTRTVYVLDPSKQDRMEWALQLNYYRIMAEAALGEKISGLRIHAIVRDGGTIAALSRGVKEKDYFFEIDILPDDIVLSYFKQKRDRLVDAMNGALIPPPCSEREAWEGRKCKDIAYCPMRDKCVAMGDNPYMAADSEEEE